MKNTLNINHSRDGIFTSESVSSGHPDKICDQIADAILDACLKVNNNSRVACEVLASNRLILIGGEITTTGYVDVVKTAWGIIKPLGYNENDFTIIANINKQSPDISKSVDHKDGSTGAGDQGVTVGYAVNETIDLMPLGTQMAHELLIQAEMLKNQKQILDIGSDMKSQVTLKYEKNKVTLEQIVISIQHQKNTNLGEFKREIYKKIVLPTIKKIGFIDYTQDDFSCLINPAGSFIIGGPIGDTGLTGRKIIVDSYGPYAHHGGGSISGKDYTKVDRTGAYYARWIAKHIVALNWANECEVTISWAIGKSKPLSININCFNTELIPLSKIINAVNKVFNYDLKSIIEILNLKTTTYLSFATYGHFGRPDYAASWEKLSKLKNLQIAL